MSSQDTGPSLAGSAAKPAEFAMEEKRYAPDGEAYTEEEFKQFYGWKHPAVWDRSPLAEPAGTQAASPGSAPVIDPQPLQAKEISAAKPEAFEQQHQQWTSRDMSSKDTTPLHLSGSAASEANRNATSASPRAPQLVHAEKSSAAQPAPGSPGLLAGVAPSALESAPQPSGITTVALYAAFTQQDLDNFPTTKSAAGKLACQVQRKLRAELLPQRVYHKELTVDEYDWRALLKSMSNGNQIVGPGIVSCCFRLLETTRDHNYARKDSGEKHVFEFKRVDGSKVQLHFHKNGRADESTLIPPSKLSAQAVLNSRTAGSHIVTDVITQESIFNIDATREPPLGRNEAHYSLMAVLNPDTSVPDAVDITNGAAIDWPRFLRTQSFAPNFVSDLGISKVFAARLIAGEAPYFRFCYPDTSFTAFAPSKRATQRLFTENWQNIPALVNAQVSSTPWLQLAQSVTSRNV